MKSSGILIFFLFVFSQAAWATHGGHFEFFFYLKSDSTYALTAVYFRDCPRWSAGAGAPGSISVRASSQQANITNNSVYLTRDSTVFSGWPNKSVHFPLECQNPDSNCREMYVYRGEWTCPKKASDWEFYYQQCCRIGAPGATPLENLGSSTSYIAFGINTTISSTNISPIWNNPLPVIPGHVGDTLMNYPLNTLCQNKSYQLNHSTTEYDGDSIVYSLIHPKTNGGDTAEYRNPYSANYPMASSTGVQIDPQSGILTLRPTAPLDIAYFTLAIQVDEYRQGTKLGYIQREITFQITDSVSTGIKQQELSDFKLYPNPSNGKFTLVFKKADAYDVRVFTSAGVEVYSNAFQGFRHSVELEGQPDGIYLLLVQSSEGVLKKRLLLTH